MRAACGYLPPDSNSRRDPIRHLQFCRLCPYLWKLKTLLNRLVPPESTRQPTKSCDEGLGEDCTVVGGGLRFVPRLNHYANPFRLQQADAPPRLTQHGTRISCVEDCCFRDFPGMWSETVTHTLPRYRAQFATTPCQHPCPV